MADTTGIKVEFEGKHFLIGRYATLVPANAYSPYLTIFVKRGDKLFQHKHSGYDKTAVEQYRDLIPTVQRDLDIAQKIMDRDGANKVPIWVENYWRDERPTDLLLLEFLKTI